MWTHLSRQSGGIGTRGPGETQLEVDRRRVHGKNRAADARAGRGAAAARHRSAQGRLRQHWPIVSLVGYTNAGKSTLLNRMTHSEVYAADQLFATLDPTTRQFVLPNKQKLLLTDTVGFLKQLPHHLIESFKATLEEVAEADLLLHVVDLSHPLYEQQMAAVQVVLEELNAWGKQMIVVFNKIDRVTNPALIEHALHKHPHSVAISAATGEGMDGAFRGDRAPGEVVAAAREAGDAESPHRAGGGAASRRPRARRQLPRRRHDLADRACAAAVAGEDQAVRGGGRGAGLSIARVDYARPGPADRLLLRRLFLRRSRRRWMTSSILRRSLGSFPRLLGNLLVGACADFSLRSNWR